MVVSFLSPNRVIERNAAMNRPTNAEVLIGVEAALALIGTECPKDDDLREVFLTLGSCKIVLENNTEYLPTYHGLCNMFAFCGYRYIVREFVCAVLDWVQFNDRKRMDRMIIWLQSPIKNAA